MNAVQQSTTTETTLVDLHPGHTGEVIQLTMEGENRRRLLDLGLVPGTSVTALFSSPLGDPTTYRIRGAMIALRAEQARQILIRLSEQTSSQDTK